MRSAGFQKLVLYNTHGGNTALIDVMARDLRAEFGLRTFALHGSGGISFEGLDPQERAYGFHAGEVETSFLLASVPELVDRSAYTANYIADIAKPELLLPENAPATFAWLTRDIASSGVMGDPRPATAEKGARWLEQAATRLAAALEAMARYSGIRRNAMSETGPSVDCGNGVRLERGVRCRMSRRRDWFPITTTRLQSGSASHAADAPAVRARHRVHRCLRPSGLVCAARIQRRDSGCARARRFRRRVLSFSQRGARRRRNDRLAAHAA